MGPARYGAGDEAGALNELTGAKVLEAVALVRRGVVPHRLGSLWGVDNHAYASGEPGAGLALATWLADQPVALTGCDTWSYGPVPAEDPLRIRPRLVPATPL